MHSPTICWMAAAPTRLQAKPQNRGDAGGRLFASLTIGLLAGLAASNGLAQFTQMALQA